MMLTIIIYQRTTYSYFSNTFWSLYPFWGRRTKNLTDEENGDSETSLPCRQTGSEW